MITPLDVSDSLHILQNNYIGRMAYIFNNKPYIVPMTYYYNQANHSLVCYSAEGHKISSLRKNNNVSFEVEDIESVDKWRTVVIHGTYLELSGSDVRYQLHLFALGVKKIIKVHEGREVDYISEFSSKIYKNDLPITFLIRVNEITGKERSYRIKEKS